MTTQISLERLNNLHAFWEAANYLSVGQIYLRSNPLLREPFKPEQIKPRLLGHFGTSPGLTLLYVHLNRLIQDTDANVLFMVGPGHGGPAMLACTFIEGCITETYPDMTLDIAGINKLMHQFSWPGGFPSHVSPPTPGSIHEGGELGYALVHAYGAAFDNPNLIVACVVGDGEAETGPLAAGWHGNKFINPTRDGAVLPILHLNGYKIAGPTVFGRMSDKKITQFFEGCGYQVRIVAGDDPMTVHKMLWETLDWAHAEIRQIQQTAKTQGVKKAVDFPMIVLRTPKGWTGPKVVDGHKVEGTFRSHQVPLSDVIKNTAHFKILEEWLRSYNPDKHFDAQGKPSAQVLSLVPKANKRMGAIPQANGGVLLKPLKLPEYDDYAIDVPSPGAVEDEATRQLGRFLRDVFKLNEKEQNFRIFCPDETQSNRLGDVFEATKRMYLGEILDSDDDLAPTGRVLEILSEHCCQGWLEGYLLSGRHGLFPCYEAFAVIIDSMVNQHAKWIKTCYELPWRKPIASLNYLLTSHAWRQDHNGYSHQGPGFIETVLGHKSHIARVYLPPDGNCLLSVADHCLRSKNYVNLIVAGKQPMPQWLNMKSAKAHCAKGASVWEWASNDEGHPDVILAAAGDVPTLEILAAAWWLRQKIPQLRVRVVNVVDLATLSTHHAHPHGFDEVAFRELFTDMVPVIFAFHGHPRVIHELTYQRPVPERFHVRGYIEEGTTTTPFDMVVCNLMSRYHLAIEALRRAPRVRSIAGELVSEFKQKLEEHQVYIQKHGEDMPEVQNWRWQV